MSDQMPKKYVVFVKEDYPRQMEVGKVYLVLWGKYRIVDMAYTNQFGTFIKGVPVKKSKELKSDWRIEYGVTYQPDNPIELLRTLYIKNSSNSQSTMVGFLVHDKRSGELIGATFEEVWSMVFKYGATNVNASMSVLHEQKFGSRLLGTIEGLPSLDSYYWRRLLETKEPTPTERWTDNLYETMEKRLKWMR